MTKHWTLWLARIALRKKGYWAIPLLLSAAFGILSALSFLAVIPSLNDRTLRALDAQLLRRAELAADHALLALGELSQGGFVGCDNTSIVQMRKAIYRYGNLKDVRVFAASRSQLCSAYSEALDVSEMPDHSMPSLVAANRNISLSPVGENGNVAMAVKWSLDDDVALDAVVSTNSLLFDILPQDLRENGTASLTLSDGRSVADSGSDQSNSERSHRVFMTSDRYPLVASIGIDADTLAKANRDPLIVTVALFSIIGFAFGLFVATLAVQSGGTIAEIDAALSRNEFLPFVQPIYSLTTREIVGVEVLARWRRADGTLVPPDRFIPIAEASGRIGPLTRHLTRIALSELRDHLRRDRQFKIAFNIAPTQLISDGFVGELRRTAVAAGVSPRQIVIEITERQEIEDVEKAAQVLAELRHRGFRVAFDDVGTGHNGLSYLQKLGADIIKIDKFLVDAIMTSHSARVLVEMLVNVGRQLGMSTVAEGIETEDQVASLKRCGVDQGQGYLLSRPISIEEFLHLIATSAGRFAFPGDRADSVNQAMIA